MVDSIHNLRRRIARPGRVRPVLLGMLVVLPILLLACGRIGSGASDVQVNRPISPWDVIRPISPWDVQVNRPISLWDVIRLISPCISPSTRPCHILNVVFLVLSQSFLVFSFWCIYKKIA